MLEKQSSSKSEYNETGVNQKRNKSQIQNDERSKDQESTILQEEKNIPNELQTQMSLTKQFTPVEITFTRTQSFQKHQVVLPTTYQSSPLIQGHYEEKKEIHSSHMKMNFEKLAKPDHKLTPHLKGDDQDVSYDKDSTISEDRRDTEVMNFSSTYCKEYLTSDRKKKKKKKSGSLTTHGSPANRKNFMIGKQNQLKRQTFDILKKRKGRSESRSSNRLSRTQASPKLKHDLRHSEYSCTDSEDDFTFRTSSTFQRKQHSPAAPASTLPNFLKKPTKPIVDQPSSLRSSGKLHKKLPKKSTNLRSESVSVNPPMSLAQEFTFLGQLCVFYASCLALQDFSKDALSVIQIGLKVDEIICRANLIKLRGLIKMQSEPKEYDGAKKDFHSACRQFQRGHSLHGAAICKAALGYLCLNKSSKDDQSKVAKNLFEEALELYEKERHYVGISYCYYSLSRIAKGTDKVKKEYQRKSWHADRNTKKGAFIHRWQGRQLSLFIEVATSHREISQEINRPSKPHTLTTKPSKMKQKSPGKRQKSNTEQNELTAQFLKKYQARYSDKYDTQIKRSAKKNQRDKSLIERITHAGSEISKAVVPNMKSLAKKGGQIYQNLKSSFFNQTAKTPSRMLLSQNPPETEVAGITTLSTHSSTSQIKKKKMRVNSDSEIKFDSSSSLIDVTKQKTRLTEQQNWKPVRLSKSKGKKSRLNQSQLSSFNTERKDQLQTLTDELGKTFKKEASAFAHTFSSSMRSAFDSTSMRNLSDAYHEATAGGIIAKLQKLGSKAQSKEVTQKEKKIKKSTRNAKVKIHSLNALKGGIRVGGSEDTLESRATHPEK